LKFENHPYCNCKITLDNNETYRINANWMHNENIDNWKDWECSAGQQRILIEADLTVYSGECLNDLLGNLATGWALFDNPTTCQQPRCTGCTDDLIVFKKEKQ